MIDLTDILAAFSFMMGAAIASFLNVVIWRVPRGESIVSPPSHCPKCGAAIHWYQNIPIISWLALFGRCANCREPISSRYILIETVGGLLFLAAFLRFGVQLWTLVMWIWLSLMIVGTMIDYDHKLLPDFVTIGGMVLGVLANGIISLVSLGHSPFAILQSLVGLGFGFGLLWLVRYVGSKAFKREAMGMGDVFLIGAVGAISGPIAVIFVLVISSFLGSIGGVSLMLIARRRPERFVEIPYGPYICAAHLLYLFYGSSLISAYLQLVGLR